MEMTEATETEVTEGTGTDVDGGNGSDLTQRNRVTEANREEKFVPSKKRNSFFSVDPC
jgi:hypothetical protein